jgi:hypothetical protein
MTPRDRIDPEYVTLNAKGLRESVPSLQYSHEHTNRTVYIWICIP